VNRDINRDVNPSRLSRRALLQRAGLAAAVLTGVPLTGCSDTSSQQTRAAITSGSSSPCRGPALRWR